MRGYTTISQSKKLLELGLSPDTADMNWFILPDTVNPKWIARTFPYINDGAIDGNLPCWSLASLLGVLPDYTLQTNTDGTVFVVCDSKKPMISDAYDNPVDACVAMIERLHKLNLL